MICSQQASTWSEFNENLYFILFYYQCFDLSSKCTLFSSMNNAWVYLWLVVEIFGHVVLADPVLMDSVWANVLVHVKACTLKPWHTRKCTLSNCCGVNFDFYLYTCIYVSVYFSSLSSLWESLPFESLLRELMAGLVRPKCQTKC